MTEEVMPPFMDLAPQCIGCGWPERFCDCYDREVDLCRYDLADKIAARLAYWWRSVNEWMAEGESYIDMPKHIIELQEEAANLENDTHSRLAAENARLRAAIQAELQRWRREVSDFADAGVCDFNDVPMPAHLVALQNAIYREGEKP